MCSPALLPPCWQKALHHEPNHPYPGRRGGSLLAPEGAVGGPCCYSTLAGCLKKECLLPACCPALLQAGGEEQPAACGSERGASGSGLHA